MKNKMNTPLILVGFMGTGKTTLGKHIAEKDQLTYVDLDEFIVQQEAKSIPEIFEEFGEETFRSLEYKYLTICINQFDIISTGGGIIEGEHAYNLLKNQNYVVWLDCELNILYNRIKNDSNRPNANNKSFSKLKSLYSSRVSRYNEIAFIKVNSSKSLSNLYNEIMKSM
ncbi:shikimate kinase [Staphylococcus nepalensis]|uniref:Shikimate kinase n=2 Tax=Staphylococcus TaxID=1279 RepID=A0A291JKP1_9STAP|nr:shikimate kinase [Staphylococcus nepalensis]VDG67003.1 shikimate dehydrogenase [Lacrimispora indolis]ATH65090.1 shikimate kinase [Staphylococcus nepalensis]AWI44456.1 shikimate kinase [Staphylococcus nepalensis]POA00301.1 shikimate kinase [Staphylococcus nepalensis]